MSQDDLFAGVPLKVARPSSSVRPSAPSPSSAEREQTAWDDPFAGVATKTHAPGFWGSVLTSAVESLPAFAGSAIGFGLGGPPGAAVGGAAGGVLGSSMGQGLEVASGVRERINPFTALVAGGVSAIPAFGNARSVLGGIVRRGAEGALLSGGQYGLTELGEGRTPTVGGALTAGGTGLALGTPFGAMEGRMAQRLAAPAATAATTAATTAAPAVSLPAAEAAPMRRGIRIVVPREPPAPPPPVVPTPVKPAAPRPSVDPRAQAMAAIDAQIERQMFDLTLQRAEAQRAGDLTRVTELENGLLELKMQAAEQKRNWQAPPTPAPPAPPVAAPSPTPMRRGVRIELIEPPTPPPAAAAPAVAPTPTPTPTGVPMMITKPMQTRLRALGYTQADIDKMTPQQAHDRLSVAPVEPTPVGETTPVAETTPVTEMTPVTETTPTHAHGPFVVSKLKALGLSDEQIGSISPEQARGLITKKPGAETTPVRPETPVVAEGAPPMRTGRTFAPLPKALAKGSPNYGLSKTQFESDLDKAAYIIAKPGPKRSKADAEYLAYVMDQTGFDEAGARAYGAHVVSRVKELTPTDNVIHVPAGSPWEEAAPELPVAGPRDPRAVLEAGLTEQVGHPRTYAPIMRRVLEDAEKYSKNDPAAYVDAWLVRNAREEAHRQATSRTEAFQSTRGMKANYSRLTKEEIAAAKANAPTSQAMRVAGPEPVLTYRALIEAPVPHRFADLPEIEKRQVRKIRSEMEEYTYEPGAVIPIASGFGKGGHDYLRLPREGNASVIEDINRTGKTRTGLQVRRALDDWMAGKGRYTAQTEDIVRSARERAYYEQNTKYEAKTKYLQEDPTGNAWDVAPGQMWGLPKKLGTPHAAKELDVIDYVAHHTQEIIDANEAAHPRLYNGDNFSELIGAHTDPEKKDWANYHAVRSSATRLTDLAYTQALRDAPPDNSQPILMMGGGPGVGKSTSEKALSPIAYATLDTTLRDPVRAARQINQALLSGRGVIVNYVHLDPLEAFKRTLTRTNTTGRPVPIDDFIQTHLASPQTLAELHAKYGQDDRVIFDIVDNSTPGAPPRDVQWVLDQTAGYTDVDAFRAHLYDTLDGATQHRVVTPEQAVVIRGEVGAPAGEGGVGPLEAAGVRGGGGRGEGAGGGDVGPLGESLGGGDVQGAAGGVTPPPDDIQYLHGGLGAVPPDAASAAFRRGWRRMQGLPPEGGGGLGESIYPPLKPLKMPPGGPSGPSGAYGPEAPTHAMRTRIGKVIGEPVPAQQPLSPERIEGEQRYLQHLPEPFRDGVSEIIERNRHFSAQRRGVQPIDRSNALAAYEIVEKNKLLPKGSTMNDVQMTAARGALNESMNRVTELSEAIIRGDATDAMKLEQVQAVLETIVLTANTLGVRAETGRALGSLGRVAKALKTQDMKAIEEMIKGATRAGLDPTTLAADWAGLGNDPIAKMNFIRGLTKAGTLDWFKGYFFSNILSGPRTHLRNLLGNTSNAVFRMVSQPAALAWDVGRTALTGKDRTIYAGEAYERMKGAMTGLLEGLEDGRFALKHGFTRDALGTFDVARKELQGGGANPLNWTGRLLEAEDQVFYKVNYKSELLARLYAHARQQKVPEPLRAAQIAEWTLAPPKAIHEAANQAALNAVYKEKGGKLVEGLTHLKSQNKWIDFILPFVRTPGNLLRQGIEATPAAFLTSQTRAALAAGGREQAEAIGRMVTGTAALGTLAWWASAGNISGTGPKDPEERAALMRNGWKPNSLKIGDAWVPFADLAQPLSQPLFAIANAFDLFKRGEGVDPQQVLLAAGGSVLDQSFLAGISDLNRALSDYERFGDQFIERWAQSWSPFSGLQRNISQAYDPVVREPEGVVEGWRSIAPVASEGVAPKIGTLGEQIERQGNWFMRGISPISPGYASGDPVVQGLAALNITNIAVPAKKLQATSVYPAITLTVAERQQLGQATKTALAELFADPSWRNMDPEEARELVQQTVQAARSAATREIRDAREYAGRR